jgi:hypothetical protein
MLRVNLTVYRATIAKGTDYRGDEPGGRVPPHAAGRHFAQDFGNGCATTEWFDFENKEYIPPCFACGPGTAPAGVELWQVEAQTL